MAIFASGAPSGKQKGAASAPFVDLADRVDGVGLGWALVVAVAQYARKPQRHPAGVAARTLHPVECDLDYLLGSQLHYIAVCGTVGELGEPSCLPVQDRVCHAL